MYTRRSLIFGTLAVGLLAARLIAQEVPVTIQVTGAIKQSLTLSADGLSNMSRASVRTSTTGMEPVYEGVWLHGVLKKAAVPQGSALRRKAPATCVLAEAQDGDQVVFSLGELDPAFIDNEILLAGKANRLLVPKGKPGARSVRMLTKIEVVQVRK